jgi:hypothetical protein
VLASRTIISRSIILRTIIFRTIIVPTKIENAPSRSAWSSEVRLLAWLATCVSVFSLLFYFQRGEALLYGDAVAHINIARRVFDSKTPSLLQLGTVWLPLPHLLMIPFLISNEMWRRGVGGSIPSMVAYVFGVIGMFRLIRGTLSRALDSDRAAGFAAWTAALIYAANPNLIYMQATAMGESLYLALFIWTIVYFSEFWRGDARALTKCGLCLAAACLTRYDGWFLAAVVSATLVGLSLLSGQSVAPRVAQFSRTAAVKFLLIAAAAPALWLAYNGIVYRNPLEFANGPYSAKAIEQRSENSGSRGHPGSDNPVLAGMYFLKSAEVNLAENQWLQRAWILFAFAVVILAFWMRRRPSAEAAFSLRSWLPLLFLLAPVPFYALSVAYGGVPIFIPPWWPFSHYNVRYGLQLLPAFAAALAMLVYVAVRSKEWNSRLRVGCVVAVLVLVISSYASIWRATPVSLKEAQVNMRTRNQLETQLAIWLRKLPPNSTLLMYLGDHVGALQQAGIPLKRVINEGNHRVWKQPSDPDGLWERALADPAKYADYVVAFQGDRVWQAAQARHLEALLEIHASGQAPALLYRGR